jgi:phosphoserine phosphatase
MSSPSHRIVLHIAGPDRPGVTARLTEVIAQDDAAELIDIGQSVLHGYLVLSAIVDIPPGSSALRQIMFAVADLGLRLEAQPLRPPDEGSTPVPGDSLCITLLGPLGDATAVARLTRHLASLSMNIRGVRSLNEAGLNTLELLVDLPPGNDMTDQELASLRGDLLRIGMDLPHDLAVQKDDIFRRSKRLVCMDVDSTFVKGELIDELAAMADCKPQVAEITARAMRGEIDFEQALTERVRLLEGLPMERAVALCSRFELTPGAEEFVQTLHGLGYRVGLVSGGFDFFVKELEQRFGLDFTFANKLEVRDGILTGRVEGPIVDAPRKAQILREMADLHRFRLEQTVAIGDGANDIPMLQTAGLGIAYRAKPKLQEVADMSLNHGERLDTLLYLMGYSSQELRSIR